ncbi:CvpA family protein [Acetobacter orientalis]|uniref:CvpA family protein n=1 Tax=Acetobacter orientalis TaxID=146474 RepID=UPI0039E99D47
MAVLDGITLVLIGLSTLHGLWRGFTQQALGIGGWILSVMLACRYYGLVIPWARSFIHNHLTADIAAFIGLLLVLLVVVSLLVSAIVRMVQATALSGLDRTLGGIFGLLRGGFLIVVLFLGAQWLLLPEDVQSLEENSRLTPYIQRGAATLRPFLPDFGAKGLASERSTGHDATL